MSSGIKHSYGEMVACTECGQVYPYTAEFFRTSRRVTCGCTQPCRECAVRYNRARRAAKAGRPLPPRQTAHAVAVTAGWMRYEQAQQEREQAAPVKTIWRETDQGTGWTPTGCPRW